jgi:hypothetical protein
MGQQIFVSRHIVLAPRAMVKGFEAGNKGIDYSTLARFLV